jgi:hypothetical protein
MPNLSCFTSYQGKIYCYNGSTDRIVEVKLEDVPLVDCPEEVVTTIIHAKRHEKLCGLTHNVNEEA